MLSRGAPGQALHDVEQTRGPERVAAVLRAAVEAGTVTDPIWAGALVPYRTIEAGFVGSLKNFGAFDAMLPSMLQLPPQTRIVAVVTAATGSIVGEAQPKPISEMSLNAGDIEAQKAVCIVVISDELAKSPGAIAFLSKELQRAVAGATDGAFLTALIVGETPIAATANPAADIAKALATITVTAASRLFLAVPPPIAAGLSLKSGTLAFRFPISARPADRSAASWSWRPTH